MGTRKRPPKDYELPTVLHAIDCTGGRYRLADRMPLDRHERLAQNRSRRKRQKKIIDDMLRRCSAIAQEEEVFSPGR